MYRGNCLPIKADEDSGFLICLPFDLTSQYFILLKPPLQNGRSAVSGGVCSAEGHAEVTHRDP